MIFNTIYKNENTKERIWCFLIAETITGPNGGN